MARRNDPCWCNSGKRVKHCCGPASDPHALISDAQIESAVFEADDVGLAANEEPKDRAFHNVLRVLEALGVDGVVLMGAGTPPIVERVRACNSRLFRPQDEQVGGLHLGAIMYRDIFCRFHVPLTFGKSALDPFKIADFSDDQKRLLGSDSKECERFIDQALDLLDFGLGWMEFGHGRTVSGGQDLIFRAHIQLEAAAAVATGAGDFRGMVQSSILGAELALKAGLSAEGFSPDEIKKKFGHNLPEIASELGRRCVEFDADRVMRTLALFPLFAQSRYVGEHPTRGQAGHTLMGAQYVASEVTRIFSPRNIRMETTAATMRAYPL